jgi:hypothetical protein
MRPKGFPADGIGGIAREAWPRFLGAAPSALDLACWATYSAQNPEHAGPTDDEFPGAAMYTRFTLAAALAASSCVVGSVQAQTVQVGAAVALLESTDDLVIAGGILPGKAVGQEGELRASAVVVQGTDGAKACLISCDVLMVARDVLDRAAKEIEGRTGIAFDAILISSTHTHHAPSTVTIHGYERDEAVTAQLEAKIVEAAVAANARLAPSTLCFRMGEESAVGGNSRLYLGDGTIFWIGPRDDAVRPTGPFDPQLAVLAFRSLEGKLQTVLFNHSTHTIGTHRAGVRSPSFYGLAAQELERQHGGTFVFLEGASGSTHNLDLAAREATVRIKGAVDRALREASPIADVPVRALRSELPYSVRSFDEAGEDAAVATYCRRRVDAINAERIVEVFRKMRGRLAAEQNRVRKTWVQAIALGDVAIVAVPAEYFTSLGLEIKARSPFRHTIVVELANDYIGYVPDDRGYDLGGYQVWTGLHSFVARGTGEAIAREAVALLERLEDR